MGCSKGGITPASTPKNSIKTDTLNTTITTTKTNPVTTYDWYNGTTGTALIQVICNDCTAIATIGNVTTPFLFNDQGIGQLKYTPTPGLSVYIAVCPGTVKMIKADIFDATNTSLYTYSGATSNWNTTYTINATYTINR
jgi:hypothetical protein